MDTYLIELFDIDKRRNTHDLTNNFNVHVVLLAKINQCHGAIYSEPKLGGKLRTYWKASFRLE